MKNALLSIALLFAGFLTTPAFAIDQVTLNNGQVVEGTVLNDIPNRYVDIRLINGDTKRFQKTEVASVDRDVPSRKDRDQFGNQSRGFVSVNLGGFYGLNNGSSNNNVLFDYGAKFGVITGQLGESKLAFTLGYDRASTSVGSTTTAYNDLNLQMLLMRIGNSGFYFGPNIGLSIISFSTDILGTSFSSSTTNFEAGAGAGYEVYFSDGFSIGPDVRYEYVFGNKISELKFTLAGAIHF
jgi:hypothetical protein